MIKLGVSDPTLGLSDLQLCNLMKKYVSFAQMASYLNEKKTYGSTDLSSCAPENKCTVANRRYGRINHSLVRFRRGLMITSPILNHRR